jgi:hypothetical protein
VVAGASLFDGGEGFALILFISSTSFVVCVVRKFTSALRPPIRLRAESVF